MTKKTILLTAVVLAAPFLAAGECRASDIFDVLRQKFSVNSSSLSSGMFKAPIKFAVSALSPAGMSNMQAYALAMAGRYTGRIGPGMAAGIGLVQSGINGVTGVAGGAYNAGMGAVNGGISLARGGLSTIPMFCGYSARTDRVAAIAGVVRHGLDRLSPATAMLGDAAEAVFNKDTGMIVRYSNNIQQFRQWAGSRPQGAVRPPMAVKHLGVK